MTAIEDFAAFWTQQCLASGGSVEGDGPARLSCPIWGAYPLRGLLVHPGPTPQIVDDVQPYLEDGRPFSVTTQAAGAGEALQALGLHRNQDFAMVEGPVRDLGAPAHAVEWVQQAHEFVTIQAAAHGIPPHGHDDLAKAWERCVADGGTHLVLVRVDGQAVGCGALFTQGGNAGLYAGSVLESHRRQGIARSALQACMHRAQEMGLTTAVGATTPDGHAFTDAFGFETVGRLQQYVWFPPR